MAKSRNALLLLLLFLLVSITTVTFSEYTPEEEFGLSLAATKHKHKHSGLSEADCPGACQYRCSKTAYKKPCLFFCQKCCYACKCVPPGTYSNKEKCPCYNSWKTQERRALNVLRT